MKKHPNRRTTQAAPAWTTLSTDLVRCVLLFLDTTSIVRALQCCSAWAQAATTTWPMVARRDLGNDNATWNEHVGTSSRDTTRLRAHKNWRRRRPAHTITRPLAGPTHGLALDTAQGVVLDGDCVRSCDSLAPLGRVDWSGCGGADIRLWQTHSGHVVFAWRTQTHDAEAGLFTMPLQWSNNNNKKSKKSSPMPLRLDGHAGAVRFVSTRNGLAVTAASDQTVRLWDLHHAEQRAAFHLPGQVYRMFTDWSCGLCYVELLPPTPPWNASSMPPSARHSVLHLQTGQLAAAPHNGGGHSLLALHHNLWVWNASSSASDNSDGTVVVDGRSRQVVCRLATTFAESASSVAFSDSTRLLIRPRTDSCDSCALRIYDTRKWRERARVRVSGRDGCDRIWLEDAGRPESEFTLHSGDWVGNGHCCSHRAAIQAWECDEYGLLVHAAYKPVSSNYDERHSLTLFKFY